MSIKVNVLPFSQSFMFIKQGEAYTVTAVLWSKDHRCVFQIPFVFRH